MAWRRHVFSPSRRNLPELCIFVPPSKPRGRREGRVLTSHPRSAAQKARAGRTAQQHTGGANHSAFPARWSDGLCRALPGAELSFWPPSLQRNSPAPRRLTRSPHPQELGRSNDGQDHTVLPYARLAMSAKEFDDVVHVAAYPLARRTCQRRSSARCPGAHGEQSALPQAFAPDAAASTASPARENDEHMIAPQG